jgi:hypothetical protein|tara:strand:+ start:50 stop:655 length:606 start_codon:yes stop_codon:yes gene_type:complete
MNKRKKKIYIIQSLFLISGLIILFFTYKGNNSQKTKINSKEINQNNFITKDNQNDEGVDVFYNIKYSGLDLAGNRYILKAEKASADKVKSEMIIMNSVNAVFYFKDETELVIFSKEGIYNNKTLDIIFTKDVEAKYDKNKLFSQKAEYSNSKNHVIISNNVRIKSEKGNMFADKLFFDIKEKTLNISSFNDNKINANIELK